MSPHGSLAAFLILFMALVACASTPDAQVLPAPPADPRLAQVGFLAGAWAAERDGMRFDEQWAPAAGGTMLGTSRVVKDDRTLFYEFMLLEHTAEGIFFRVRTASRPEVQVSFRLVPSERPGAIAFENPTHDFPTRITYWLDGANMLRARIEGTREGAPASEDFLFYRTSAATVR